MSQAAQVNGFTMPAGTTHFCPAFGRYPNRALRLEPGDVWFTWTGFDWHEVKFGPPPSVRREMIDLRPATPAALRNKACDEMFGVILSLPEDRRHNRSDICEALYDAGYRKP